jgi:hypothetical protein
MILAFADDRSVTAFDNVLEANAYCEGPDVKAGIYTFLDEHGRVLSAEQSAVGPAWAGNFNLIQTNERREDLLRAIFDREVAVDKGPRIHTYEELIRELPQC